jgi:hypothetical protein
VCRERINCAIFKPWNKKYTFSPMQSSTISGRAFLSWLDSHASRSVLFFARTTCRRRWIRSISGVVLTGETEVLGWKPVQLSIYPPQISHWLIWDRKPVSTVRCRRLTAYVMPRSLLFLLAQQPPVDHDLLIHEISSSHTTTQHIW